MTAPILETIANKIVTRLQRITVANGYFYDITPERLKNINQPEHLKAIVYQDRSINDEGIQNERVITTTFAIATFVIPPQEDTTAIDEYMNKICACIQMALLTDSDGNFEPQLDGAVRRIDITPPDFYQIVKQGPEGVTFYADIQYSTPLV